MVSHPRCARGRACRFCDEALGFKAGMPPQPLPVHLAVMSAAKEPHRRQESRRCRAVALENRATEQAIRARRRDMTLHFGGGW
jgi:hypothetical protein